MPYFPKNNLNRRGLKRPNAHVWLQEDAYEYVPPAADVLYVHPTTEHSDVERAAKRRRIAAIATAFENGKTPHILTAALKGPFDSNWNNPWGDKDQSGDALLVSQLRAMLRQQREDAEAARIQKIERKKQKRQDRLERKLRATELQQDGLGRSPTLPVDLTTDERRCTLDPLLKNGNPGSAKRSTEKDVRNKGEGWLRRQRSCSDILKSSPPNSIPICSLPIRSSQVEAGNDDNVGLAPSQEDVTVRDSTVTEPRARAKHASRAALQSASTKTIPRRTLDRSAQKMADSSFSPDRIPSSRPDDRADSQQKARVKSPSKFPTKGALSKFSVAYQHATPAAGSSPGFAYRRVGNVDKEADPSNPFEVLVPGTEQKAIRARPRTSRPVSFDTPVIPMETPLPHSTKANKTAHSLEAAALGSKSPERIQGTGFPASSTPNSDGNARSQRSTFNTQISRKGQIEPHKRESPIQNAQVANAFTISNEQFSTQAAMLEVHSAFQEAIVSLEPVPLTEQGEEACQATPDQRIPEIVDTVTPFRDFRLRDRSRSPTSRDDLVAMRNPELNTQDLFAAVSPFRGSTVKASREKNVGLTEEATKMAEGSHVRKHRRKSLPSTSMRDGHGKSNHAQWSLGRQATSQLGSASSRSRNGRKLSFQPPEVEVLRQTPDHRSTTPRSRESQSPSSPSSEFSRTSPTDKAQAMTFEEGQKLLSRDILDVDANLDAMGSFLESWDIDKTPSLARSTPKGSSSRLTGTQRSKHSLLGHDMA